MSAQYGDAAPMENPMQEVKPYCAGCGLQSDITGFAFNAHEVWLIAHCHTCGTKNRVKIALYEIVEMMMGGKAHVC